MGVVLLRGPATMWFVGQIAPARAATVQHRPFVAVTVAPMCLSPVVGQIGLVRGAEVTTKSTR